MTCPCRGELCNGANTQREIDAFITLSNTVARTHNNRIIKRNSIASGFINSNKYRITNLIENDAHNELNNLIDNDVTRNETIDDSNMQPDQSSSGDNEHLNISSSNDGTRYENEPDTSESHDGEPEVSRSQDTESNPNESHDNESNVNEFHESQLTESDSHVNEPNGNHNNDHTEQRKEAKTTKVGEDDTEENKEIQMTYEHETTTSLMENKITEIMKSEKAATNVEENAFVSNEIKPSMQLPTAEALQQSVSPSITEIPVELTVATTEATTHVSTFENDKNMTPKPTKSTKNSSEVISYNIFVLFTCWLIKEYVN